MKSSNSMSINNNKQQRNQTPSKKRLAPKEVTPIVFNGIKYTVPHFSVLTEGMKHNGGYVEALDLNGKRIWLKEVYSAKIDSSLEKDVQDTFITAIKIKNNKLIITNEKNKIFELPL